MPITFGAYIVKPSIKPRNGGIIAGIVRMKNATVARLMLKIGKTVLQGSHTRSILLFL